MRDLFAHLVDRQEGLHLANLDELGRHLIERLDELVTARFLSPDYCANGAEHSDAAEQNTAEENAVEPNKVERCPAERAVERHVERPGVTVRADGPSADRFEGSATSPFAREPRAADAGQTDHAARTKADGHALHRPQAARPGDGLLDSPSELLEVDSAEAVELLEKLDDCVFDAISGDQRALAEVTRLWPEVVLVVGPERLEESREQYLRYSLSIWESCLDEGLREPKRAVASLAVLNVLFGG